MELVHRLFDLAAGPNPDVAAAYEYIHLKLFYLTKETSTVALVILPLVK